MLNDFIPIINRLKVKDHPHGITIVPLADAHYGSQEFNEVRWHKALKRIYDDPHCFAVIVGDLIDNATRNSVTNIFQATCSPKAQKEWLYNELKCLADAGKILAAVGGNHERRSGRDADDDPMYDVMVRLGIEEVYRPTIAFMQTKFTREIDGKEHHRSDAVFAITHGAGNGQYIGSSANRVQTFATAVEGIDCIITGHTHKPLTFPVSKLVFDGRAKTVLQKQFTVVVASSFLDYGGYPVEKLMPPTAHAATEIQLTYYQSDGRMELRVLQ